MFVRTILSVLRRAGYGVLSLLFAVGIFLFWCYGYPQALSYQEQNQLFLWNIDYFLREIALAGGLSVWLGECFVQFYYYIWLGSLLLALLFVTFQRLVWRYIMRVTSRRSWWLYIVSFLPPGALLYCMGDYNLLLSVPVSIILCMLLVLSVRRCSLWWDILIIPIAYWLIGSMLWLYVLLRLFQRGLSVSWRGTWMIPYLLACQLVTAHTVMSHWSTKAVLLGVGYYRIPIPNTSWMWGYNRDVYEVLRYDYLIRHERWDEVIARAERYQPQAAFSSVCVNLALAKKRQLADRMFDFYQSGRDALIMGIFRDNTSDLPSMEAFWHLGMINSCLRYAFDMQEAILNARRSSRFTKRLAECYIVNGRYEVAHKHLSLLRQTLFYRSWAIEMEKLMRSEEAINSHPLYGVKRRQRFKTDFLYNYNEIDKVFGRLFVNDPSNTMALDYFMAQMLLRGSVNAFVQHMPWVQQYGGYATMPVGYADAIRCIESKGTIEGSAYGRYINFMRQTGRLKE